MSFFKHDTPVGAWFNNTVLTPCWQWQWHCATVVTLAWHWCRPFPPIFLFFYLMTSGDFTGKICHAHDIMVSIECCLPKPPLLFLERSILICTTNRQRQTYIRWEICIWYLMTSGTDCISLHFQSCCAYLLAKIKHGPDVDCSRLSSGYWSLLVLYRTHTSWSDYITSN